MILKRNASLNILALLLCCFLLASQAQARIIFDTSTIVEEDSSLDSQAELGTVTAVEILSTEAPTDTPMLEDEEEYLEAAPQFKTTVEDAYRILVLDSKKFEEQATEKAEAVIAEEAKKDRSYVWENAISLQVETLKQMNTQVDRMQATFLKSEQELRRRVEQYQSDIRQLQVLYNSNKNNPMVLEAVERRAQTLIDRLNQVLFPLKEAAKDSKEMLANISDIRQSIPMDQQANVWELPDELQSFVSTLDELTWRLNTLLAQMNAQIAPAERVLTSLTDLTKKITDSLPELWKKYYLSPPSSVFQINLWSSIGADLMTCFNNLKLRLSVEFPQDITTFISLLTRGFSIFFFVAIGIFAIYRRFFYAQHSKAINKIFFVHFAFILGGFSILTIAFGPQAEKYRILITLAIFAVVWGEYGIAHSLRKIDLEGKLEHYFRSSTLFALLGIGLLYPDLPLVFLNALWLACSGLFLLYKRRYSLIKSAGELPFEKFMLTAESLVLWISIFISVFGWARLAILLYSSFVALAVSVQAAYAAFRLINKDDDEEGNEGKMQTIVSGITTAIVVPLVLILASLGFALWYLAFPGGMQLIEYYISTGVNIGFASLNLLQLLVVLSAFYITRTLNSLGDMFITSMPTRGLKLNKSLIQPFKTGFSYALWILFGLFVLNSLGVSLTSLTVIAGGLSVGIGFGMQAIVNNFISGMILIFSRALQEGDIIEVNNVMGVVKRISVRATMVETFDSAVILVPNSEFISKQLTNWTHANKHVRKDIKVGVAYGSDVELVSSILLNLAKKHKEVLVSPGPSVFFTDFAASSLDFTLRIWIKDINVGMGVMSQLRTQIEKEFRESNIEIAFPQLDVHIKNPEHLEVSR